MGNFGKKVVSASLAVLTSVTMLGGGSFVAVAGAASAADLQAQINALLAQLQALQSTTTVSCSAPAQPLTVGSTGAGVTALQTWLVANGYGSFTATGYFGPLTQAAVAKFQVAAGITPAVGFYGPITMAALQARCATTTTTTTTTGSTTLSGGAGSVADYSLASGLDNEKVGEDENDVKVAGLEVEADQGSDLEFTAIRLAFCDASAENSGNCGTDNNTATASSDFDNYAQDVSIWLGNKEVARVDASDFNDNNDWSKTVTLDKGAVIKAGKTGTFYVAISGINNLDTNDAGDTWDLDITSVRFRDAQGATVSEDPAQAVTTFSFESFATAANTEFKITSGLDSINDAHVINVDTSDDTNDVSILSFNVEIKGDSDVNLDKLPVNFDVTGAANVDDMITGLSLWMDGEEVGSAAVGSDCLEDADCVGVGADETYLFDNLDLDLNAGSDYDFVVKVDLKSTADVDLDNGDTIAANFGETETDSSNFKAKDESGTNLADADKTGTVTGSASVVRDSGIMVTLVGTPTATKSHNGDPATTGDSDEGTFVITFDVTAFDGDAWVDHTAPDTSGGTTESDLDVTGTGTVLATITSPSGATDGTDGFKVRDGETERFAITTNIVATADGFFNVKLTDLLYAMEDAQVTPLQYTFNLADFKTPDLYLNDN